MPFSDLLTPTGRVRWWREHQFDVLCYSAGTVGLLVIYHLLSDGDFSFLLTVGSVLRLTGFLMLLARFAGRRKSPGISQKTLQLYAAVFLLRIFSDLQQEAYRPFDKTGDWLYTAVEVVAFLAASLLSYLVGIRHKAVYDWASDDWGGTTGGLSLLLGTGLVALVVHPTLAQSFILDTAWTWSLYLESLCLLPQLRMFEMGGRAVEAWMTHFVFLQFASTLCMAVFWLHSHHELSAAGSGVTGGWVGYLVLFCQATQLLLLARFAFSYISAAARGDGLILNA
eukprot:Hpha_TRINITY_DN24905_c0_g1::TRINITY_DN24905_c0_g1_i1::g.111218::m.111218